MDLRFQPLGERIVVPEEDATERGADKSPAIYRYNAVYKYNEEVEMVKRRILLLGALLVVIALTACGCVGGLIPLPIDEDEDDVNAVVSAFMSALRNQDGEAMEALLASTVVSANGIECIVVTEGNLAREAFAGTWTSLLQSSDAGVSSLQFVQGPSTTVNGSYAVSTGRILLTLDFPEDRFDDVTLKLSIDGTYPAEDIHSVRLDLQKIGSAWRIIGFQIGGGERQSAIMDAWATFAQGFFDEDVDMVLSVCTNPFYWTGLPEFKDTSTHYEWRRLLTQAFESTNNLVLEMDEVTPIEVNSRRGAFRVVIISSGGPIVSELIAELIADYLDGEWLLSAIHSISSSL